MSEFWKRKVRKYFSTFDFDNDGVISREDFVGMAERYAKFGKPDKQKAEHLKTETEKVWELYLRNAEIGDREALTVDELIVSVGKLRYDPDLMKSFAAILRGLHDMLDVNRDGYLQEDEYERIFVQVGVPDPSFAKAAFKAIDVNGDGKLSVEEYTNAFIDCLFSDDESSPYTFFYGPLDD